MAIGPLSAVSRQLTKALLLRNGCGMTDRQLLERFLNRRDEAAFEALVRRHGAMVLGVCRRVLRNAHDAEDAFQAAFLVLVRKAPTIIRRESVGSWLYGTAYRAALEAQAAQRRRSRERQVSTMPEPEVVEPTGVGRDLRLLLDRELSRLPDKYREAVVLCDLEGKTRKEAARQLGVPEGTLSGRLTTARRTLAKRLARHGLGLSGGLLALALTNGAATACVPAPLVGSTVQAAAQVAAGCAVAGAVSARVAAITEGVLKTMFTSKFKWALGVALAVALIGSGWGVYHTRAAPADPPKKEADKPALAAPDKEDAPKDDKDGDSINLPTGPAPVQVLASLDKDGKLVIKTAQMQFRVMGGVGGAAVGGAGGGPVPLPAPPAGGLPPPGGGVIVAPPGVGVGGPGKVTAVPTLQTQTYDLDDVEVLDVKAKKLDKKEVTKLLKEETVALASLYGQKVDPLHLRVVKDGTLIFVLPAPKAVPLPGVPGVAPPGVPVPLPAPGAPPGFGAAGVGGVGGGFTVTGGGVAAPATPAPPPAAPNPKEP